MGTQGTRTGKRGVSVGELIVGAIVTVSLVPLVILGLAGDWRWAEGWIFSLWFAAMVLSNMLYLYAKDPALLAERSKPPGSDNQEAWDTYLQIGLYSLMLVWLVIMPLDAKRFEWSPEFPAWLRGLGAGALLPALYLLDGATVENTYLSTAVRLQPDREQRVISTGVYGVVRHPLYLGALLMVFGAALLLGSIWGLLIGLIMLVAVVGRILGEEAMLVHGLEGYEDYEQRVRYRLVPFIW